MKIAQVVCSYPPYKGGIGRVAYEYTERLRARGHNVHVYTPRYKKVEGDPDYVHRIPAHVHVGNAGVVPSLYKRLSGFDLIHLHYPFFGGAEPTIVRKAVQPNQGLVMTYHMDAAASGLKGMIFNAHRKLLFPWLANRADRILVSSQDYADTCALKDISEVQSRIEVHPFGVEMDRFYPGEDLEIRKELKIPEGAPTFIFVGGLDPAHAFKGLPVLFEALGKLSHNKWHGIIVGSGSLRASFEKTVKEKGYGERIHFVGSVSDEDLPRYYRAADFHLFPSTKRAEAFGIVAVEAAASGIPSVASSLPGVRSVVLDGQTGVHVEPGDILSLTQSIELMLEQVDLRLRLGLAARKRAEVEFGWEPLIGRLEATYESVVNQQSKRAY
jgi:glycosyltransferase involved in cell wall biosynthesis